MPHGRRLSSSRIRRSWPALAVLAVITGCGPSAPRDAADSVASAPPPSAAPELSADELARRERARLVADSAARLDSLFRRLRDSLNAASRKLASADRRSPDYARRWDAFVARERDAIVLRARRDSLRARAAELP